MLALPFTAKQARILVNMENTTPFLFDDIDEKYFLALQGKAVGPLTAQEVYERVQQGEVTLLHFVWREGQSDWKRLCDDHDFSMLVPQKPTSASIEAIRQRIKKRKAPEPQAAPSDDTKNIYLYFNRSQYGPFSRVELFHVLKSHKLDRSAYVWMPGWPNWKRITEIKEFAEHMAPVAPPVDMSESSEPKVISSRKKDKTRSGIIKRADKSKTIEKTLGVELATKAGIDASERRRAPRRPLVARLFLHNDKDVIIAVCRDISVGGMQVLTDRVPGEAGSTIKLNVSPGDPNSVKGFVAEGEIVRVLEDGRGFSFRFTKLTAEAKKAIEKYIKS